MRPAYCTRVFPVVTTVSLLPTEAVTLCVTLPKLLEGIFFWLPCEQVLLYHRVPGCVIEVGTPHANEHARKWTASKDKSNWLSWLEGKRLRTLWLALPEEERARCMTDTPDPTFPVAVKSGILDDRTKASSKPKEKRAQSCASHNYATRRGWIYKLHNHVLSCLPMDTKFSYMCSLHKCATVEYTCIIKHRDFAV